MIESRTVFPMACKQYKLEELKHMWTVEMRIKHSCEIIYKHLREYQILASNLWKLKLLRPVEMYLYESLSHGEVCLLFAGWILRRWVLLKSWKWVKAAAMKRDVAFWPGHSNLRLMLLQAQIGKGWVKWKRLQSKDMFYERAVLEPKRFQQLKRHVTQQLDYILFCVMNSQDLLSNSVIRPSHSYQTTCVGTNTLPSPWGVCGHECRSGAKSLQGEESFGEMMEKEITKQQQQQSTINNNQLSTAINNTQQEQQSTRRRRL